jgi:hypothetical protein
MVHRQELVTLIYFCAIITLCSGAYKVRYQKARDGAAGKKVVNDIFEFLGLLYTSDGSTERGGGRGGGGGETSEIEYNF